MDDHAYSEQRQPTGEAAFTGSLPEWSRSHFVCLNTNVDVAKGRTSPPSIRRLSVRRWTSGALGRRRHQRGAAPTSFLIAFSDYNHTSRPTDHTQHTQRCVGEFVPHAEVLLCFVLHTGPIHT